MDRWREHFSELLNREEPEETLETLTEIRESSDLTEDVQSSDEADDEEYTNETITIEEVERAVKQMRKRKAPGTCNITAELLQETGNCTI